MIKVLITFSLLLTACQGSNRVNKNGFDDVTYVEAIDGDTFKFFISQIPIALKKNQIWSVRTKRADTAEKDTKNKCELKMAEKAQKYAHRVLKGAKRIDLKKTSICHYSRICAEIIYDGKNLDESLIKNKLAVPMHKRGKNDWCKLLKESKK